MSDSELLRQIQISSAPGPFFEPDAEGAPAPVNPKVRLIAFYLPQFHPIPENDAWWGHGFTEWTNVTKALPRFVGHVQPRLPGSLGFYDLRDPRVLNEQVKLARRYGIGGFCFHHYWFNGRRLLERPLELFLADSTIEMPFCVNWANENWTRRWDGQEDEILLAQSHSPEDDMAFARSLIPVLRDSRYIKVGGRPLIMIYRPGLLPEPVATMRRWRAEFTHAGLENPYIVMAQAFGDLDPRQFGVDAAAEFPPHKVCATPTVNERLRILDAGFSGHVLEYEEVAEHASSLGAPPYKLLRGVCPTWDNEPRKHGHGFALANSTPAKYGAWLGRACEAAMSEATHSDERIVFVNAWNEWAEGAVLEPDRHYGYAYLAETARVLSRLDSRRDPRPDNANPHIALVSHDAYLHGAQLIALAILRTLVVDHNVRIEVLLGGAGELAPQFEALAPTEMVPGDFSDPSAWRNAARRLSGSGATAVICNTLVSAKAIKPLCESGLRVVQLVHELPSLIRQYGLEQAARDAASMASVVVFPSAYVRDRFVEMVGPIYGRTVLRHQGLYMPRLSWEDRARLRTATRRTLGVREDQHLVLGAGFGDVRKGLDLWPALARRVLADCPKAIFVWVGKLEPSLQNWLKHDLRMTGLGDTVLLPGLWTDMAGIFSAADAFALTSREDPFPSVVIEAMASGLPTVVFEGSGGIVELVRDAGGICVPYLDVDAMGRELAHLLNRREAAAAVGAALSARISQDFDYADYGAALLALAVPAKPTVSAIVPNYNYGRYLRQRLRSIFAQRAPVYEIIVVDNASTDDSLVVIEEMAQESPIPMRVIRNEVNSGSVPLQWARGVSLAQGDIVWIAESDDFADPDFLPTALLPFENDRVVLSYTESRMVDENGHILGPNYLGYVADIDPLRWTKSFFADGSSEIAHALSIKNTIPNASAALFRRGPLQTVLRDHLEEMAACRHVADWLCYIRLLANGGTLAFVAESLNNHRRHAGSITIMGANRIHLQEIIAMQDLATTLVAVPAATRDTAIRYRAAVAKQFGIPLEQDQLEPHCSG
jgi:Glycosyltransferase WbsX/Glycosyl transferase family 2/Glycosyl transferases group 1